MIRFIFAYLSHKRKRWSVDKRVHRVTVYYRKGSAMVESLGLDELRDVLSGIERALECSVCLDTIREAATVCENGHGVCRSCSERLDGICPECRCTLTKNPSAMLNSVIRQIPRSCPNKSSGCDKVLLPTRDWAHEELCGYRGAICWLKGCYWEGLVNDILNHLQCDHPSSPLFSAENEVCQWPEVSLKPGFQSFLPIYAYSCIIWVRANMTEDSEIHLTFHLIPNGSMPSFRAVVFFTNGDVDVCGCVPVVSQKPHEEVPLAERVVLSKTQAELYTQNASVLEHSLSIVKDL